MKKSGASCGLAFNCPADIQSALQVATLAGYDFLALPIVHPRFRVSGSQKRPYSFTRSDLLLTSSEWTSLVVGIISRHLSLESNVLSVRRASEEALQKELNFASHLGLPAIMLTLTRGHNVNLSRIIYSHMLKTANCQVWIRVPMKDCKSASGQDQDPWQWWNDFRGNANTERRLNLALTVSKDQVDDQKLKRWLGEPVKCLILATNLFLVNKKGYPVLPKNVQSLVRQFYSLRVQFIIEGRNCGHDARYYQQYLDHLFRQEEEAVNADPLRKYASGYEDFLQNPLQPLMDNLESGTYEVFEKDPVKYSEYQKAIHLALLDKIPQDEAATKQVLVMVLGAGRGPLVRAALRAADNAGRKIKVIAVEKNTNAIVTLLTQKDELWGEAVEVVSSDMREWKSGEDVKADIIVSELLGSFGDNELSPECLYDAQHLFKADAISIPCSYTSWVGPLQSAKLFQEVRSSADPEKNQQCHYETPYVVHLQNRTELAAPQPLFTFEHPLPVEKIDNSRYEIRKFQVDFEAELHGFGGYFECKLYKDVMISINPATHSPGMFSWFPIFFPLRNPVKCKPGDEIELHFWRLNNAKQVWYEWCITKPVALPIHNPNGRSYTIGL